MASNYAVEELPFCDVVPASARECLDNVAFDAESPVPRAGDAPDRGSKRENDR
jgi:hypothetical protein